MSTKLTLTVDKTVIDAAKEYAKSNGRSLSNIIEEYLKALIEQKSDTESFDVSPLVNSLWGSVKPFPESTDYKEVLAEEIVKKHLE